MKFSKDYLRLNLKLPEVRPELRLVRLQEFLIEQTEADDTLRMRVNGGQSMAVANIESPEREIELHGSIIEVAERSGKHADPMMWNNPAWWSLELLPTLWRILCICVCTKQLPDLCVPREAQHDLVEDILKHKVLIVICGRELDILEHQLVHNQIRHHDCALEGIPVFSLMSINVTAQDEGPQLPPNRSRSAALSQDLLTNWSMAEGQDLVTLSCPFGHSDVMTQKITKMDTKLKEILHGQGNVGKLPTRQEFIFLVLRGTLERQ